MTESTNSHQFRAEIKQLLQILVHSLYKDREIFLRELVSNASDALARVQFEMLTNSDVVDADAELAIRLAVSEEDDVKTLIIKDSGIGMTADELGRNLGTIAQSGAREFLQKLSDGEGSPTDIIGQFGVGFYSVFMVADEVRVVSRSHQADAEAAAWISDGGETYVIESAEKADRGTEIHIRLKSDAAEFAEMTQLRSTIKKHSDFVAFPIYIDEDQINQQESMWRKAPKDVEADAYAQFYQQMTLDFEAPLTHAHFVSDAPIDIRALLFVPAKREKTMFSLRKEPGVKLYSHNVLIQEYCKDLLPEWLSFIDGVVDSEDLPLNVSRETVHNNRFMLNLARTVRKRAVRMLNKLAKDDEAYKPFYDQYSRVLKEGVATDQGAQDDILPLLRFASSADSETPIALQTYVERMQAEQEAIYYVLGDDVNSVKYSPHLDPFKARDIEVLYLVDPIDPFLMTSLTTFAEQPFKSIDDASLDLAPVAADDEESTEDAVSEKDANAFIGRCVATLGDSVSEVRATKVLRDSAIRLVSNEDDPNSGMQRIYRIMDEQYEVPQKIMEVNMSHPLVVNLAAQIAAEGSAELIDLSIEQLYESALVQEGLHPNPTSMLPRIQRLLELATDQ